MSKELDVVRGLYGAFAAGDMPAVLAALSPTVRWVGAEGGPYGGVFTGPDAVLENVFAKLGDEWDGFTAAPAEYVADGATVVVLGEYSATFKATGRSFRSPFAHVWKLEDGRVVFFQQYVDTVLHRRPMEG